MRGGSDTGHNSSGNSDAQEVEAENKTGGEVDRKRAFAVTGQYEWPSGP